VVHRDINPNNILVCEMGGMRDVIKLLDFGLVTTPGTEDQRLTSHGAFMGSPMFVSPEQARGLEVDARSDLYSVGAVAHFLLTGHPPFERETTMDVLFAHCNAPPPPPSRLVPDLGPEIDALVLRCLNKAPADRFPNADALDTSLAECPVGAAWDPKQAPARRPVSRSGLDALPKTMPVMSLPAVIKA
jgi:serine/threonine-protein kinase